MKVDPESLLVPGEWEHTFVPANATRLHVAVAGPIQGPLVLLLHAFPQNWFSWRHQIPPLAAQGYRVAAMDIRGFGSSDKPPGRSNGVSIAADVSGVIRSLGAREAVIVGQGYGAQIAWSMPGLEPDVTRAIATLSTPHPLLLRRPGTLAPRTMLDIAYAQVPWFPERRLEHDWAIRCLQSWGAPGWRSDAEDYYQQAMRQPAVAHSVLEQARWQSRSIRRASWRHYVSALRRPIEVPVLGVHGRRDRAIGARARRRDAEFVSGDYRFVSAAGAGHFLTEEVPELVTHTLLEFLEQVN